MNECHKIKECPIFKVEALKDENGKLYKDRFCLIDNHVNCKRYIAYNITKSKIPLYIMPNSQKSIDDIVALSERD